MEKILSNMEEAISEDALTVYEVSYLLLPSVQMEQIQSKALALKEMITSLGGLVISDENPVLIDLSYTMTKVVVSVRHKVSSGYFGWIKFEISKEGIMAVKKNLDANPEILRFLIIKTVRENTLLAGKMKLQKEEKVVKSDEDVFSEIPEIEKEAVSDDLDKSIDDLVIA